MKPLKVLLSDLRHLNEYSKYDQYVPLNLGYMVSHIKRLYGNAIDVSLILDSTEFLTSISKNKPDVIGFSLYAWNAFFTHTMIKAVREKLGKEVVIVVGGQSVDTEEGEQWKLFGSLEGVDYIVPGEGEFGFGNIIGEMLSLGSLQKSTSIIDGAVFNYENTLVKGENSRPQTDLLELDSPYLKGYLDKFLRPPYKPLVLTTRGCPYTCTYCVSGRKTGKIRKFSNESIKAELTYIAKKYCVDGHHMELFLADDNFGLFKDDLKIAEDISEISKEFGYPVSVDFYSDKKYTETSRGVKSTLKDLNDVYWFSQQSGNPKTLQLVKRKNLTDETIFEAVGWAKEQGLRSATELICGLPHETKESFLALLEKCTKFDFDLIATNSLLLLDGAALNLPDARKEFEFKTKYRLFTNSYGYVNDVFTAESEEVVVSSNSFSFDDFISMRYQMFMFYAVYRLYFQFFFFRELRHTGIKVTDFIDAFFYPDENEVWPEGYLKFISDLKEQIVGELYDTKEDLRKSVEQKYRKNSCKVLPPTKINVIYSTRLVYQESEWTTEVFRRILKKFSNQIDLSKNIASFDFLLDFYKKQLINPRDPSNCPSPLNSLYDVTAWSQAVAPLTDYRMKEPVEINFHFRSPNVEKRFVSFVKANHELKGFDYFYAAVEQLKGVRYSFTQSHSQGYHSKKEETIMESAVV